MTPSPPLPYPQTNLSTPPPSQETTPGRVDGHSSSQSVSYHTTRYPDYFRHLGCPPWLPPPASPTTSDRTVVARQTPTLCSPARQGSRQHPSNHYPTTHHLYAGHGSDHNTQPPPPAIQTAYCHAPSYYFTIQQPNEYHPRPPPPSYPQHPFLGDNTTSPFALGELLDEISQLQQTIPETPRLCPSSPPARTPSPFGMLPPPAEGLEDGWWVKSGPREEEGLDGWTELGRAMREERAQVWAEGREGRLGRRFEWGNGLGYILLTGSK